LDPIVRELTLLTLLACLGLGLAWAYEADYFAMFFAVAAAFAGIEAVRRWWRYGREAVSEAAHEFIDEYYRSAACWRVAISTGGSRSA
jgi:hypothetical protein